MYFSFFPPISIEGDPIEKDLDIPGLENLKSIFVSSERVTFVLEEDNEKKSYEIFKFNDPTPDINYRIDIDEDFPLELMPTITVEVLENLAVFLGGYTLIHTEKPEAGYLEFFRGDLYPIPLRGADKRLYEATAELRCLRKDYFVALNNLLEVDFESQLETSLATFVDNVLNPMTTTMREVYSLDDSLDRDNSIINIIGGDFKKLLTMTEDLINIVDYNMEQTAERNKAFLRLTLPLMLKQAILENFTEYFHIKYEHNSIKLDITKRKTIDTKDLINLILHTFR
ncbi:MAG: hypothetical protein ACTSPG_07790 [Candidatus Hodarchaeales archaeon]